MEPVSTIATTVISLTLTISQIVTEVQQNREDCLELGEKVERLLPLITPLETATKEDLEKLSSIKTLEKLAKILTSTEEFLSRFVESKKNNGMLSKLWRLGSEALDKNEINETFRNLDKKLDSILIEFTALQTTTRSRTSANLRTERFAAIEDTFCEDPPIADYHDHRSILGRGAYGTTHRMINTTDGRRYAVKRLLLSEAKKKGVSTDMLMNECLLLEKLTHPHISRYFLNFYSKNNMYFNIVMELIQGGTLEDKIPGRPPPTELEIVTWAKQMASALSYMHGEGVMHRDLKPDNVMLSESSKVKIIDLGLASVITSAEMHSMAGTDLYSSYEKLTPGVPYDNRDDIWAMGCILLELLLQTRLTHSIAHPHNKQVTERRNSLLAAAAEVSPELGGYVLPNLLSPEQEGRWTAEELVQALSSLRSSVRRQSMNYPASAKLFGSDSIAPPCERGTVSMRLPATTSMPTLEKESTRSRAQSCIFTGPTGRADDANQLPLGRVSPPPPPRPPRPAHLRSNSPQPPLVHVSLSVPCGVALPPAPLTPVLLPVPVDSTDDLANVASTDLPADPATDSISSPPPRPPRPVHNTSPIPAKVVVGEIMKEPVVVHETHHDLHLPRPKALEALEAVRFKQLDTAEVLAQANSGRQDLVKKSIPALVLLLKFGALGIQEQAVAALGVLVLDEQSRKIIAAAGAIVPLVQVLKEGPECLKEETAWVLRNLALDVQNIKLFRSTDAITALVALLKSGTDGARYQAAAALRNQAEDVKSRKAIAEAGAIPLLVQLLSAEAEDAQVQAAGALESLAEVAANVKTIVAAGAVDPLVQLLRDGSTNYAQEAAAAALMSFGADCVANAKTVAATGVIPLLVKLLREGTEVGKEKAAGTLRNLAIEAENKKLIAAEGTIPLLVHLLRDGSADVQLASAGALRNLAVDVQNKHIIAAEGGIPPLVHLLSEGSDQAKGIAVVALQNLVDSCEENLVLLRAASAVEPLWALKMSGIYGVSFASKLLTLLE